MRRVDEYDTLKDATEVYVFRGWRIEHESERFVRVARGMRYVGLRLAVSFLLVNLVAAVNLYLALGCLVLWLALLPLAIVTRRKEITLTLDDDGFLRTY